MVDARLYKPAKSATQSGRARTRYWVLEFEPKGHRDHDPVMGWVGSDDTGNQVRLRFNERTAAEAFCERNGYSYEMRPPHSRRPRLKAYADNFRWDAVEQG